MVAAMRPDTGHFWHYGISSSSLLIDCHAGLLRLFAILVLPISG